MYYYWKHENDPICYNCRHWKHIYPEADGRSYGLCKRLSGDGWRYDYIPLRSDSKLIMHTRSDFGCNQFSKRITSGRIEPEIEDES